jgi:eukaryotic-like serine/threonine-protein kinase
MGAVWEGTHTTLGTRVAVKFIDPEYADSPDARNRFENEARAAASLRSKHVVEMYDHGLSEDGSPFIVMEYLEGEPLDQRLDREGRLSPAETARILLQACRAVARAHGAGIVHRDLKPENLFLVWDDEEQSDFVKVLDFGIAKFTDRSVNVSSATRTGSVLGTPFYMSPEQARGLRSVDQRTDIWSLGVIAYRCIVGSLPFDGEAIGDLLVRLCTEPIPVPSQVVADVPPGFDAFIQRALSRDLTQRFQSVQEFADSLARTCGVASRSMLASADPSNPTPELPRVRQRLSGGGSNKARGDETGGALVQSTDPTRARRSRTVLVMLSIAVLTVLGLGVGIAAKVLAGRADAPVMAAKAPERDAITLVRPPAAPSPASPILNVASHQPAAAPPPASAAPAAPSPQATSPRPTVRRLARPPSKESAPEQKPGKRPIDLGY